MLFGSMGDIGTGFWARYQAEVEKTRAEYASRRHWPLAMTTQNLLVRHVLFESAGGFSTAYTHYGFEDRDLIVRLLAGAVSVLHVPTMRVLHNSGNTLSDYCEKMEIAGRYSAPVFFAQHPALYREMPYAKIDPATGSWLMRRVYTPFVLGFRRPIVRFSEYILAVGALPFRLKLFAVKLAAAASYMDGAARR